MQIEGVNYVIDLFRKKDSKFCEIVATLFAVWDKRIKNANINSFGEEDLYKDFYNWSKEKAQFKKGQLSNAFSWMKENRVVPNGAQ